MIDFTGFARSHQLAVCRYRLKPSTTRPKIFFSASVDYYLVFVFVFVFVDIVFNLPPLVHKYPFLHLLICISFLSSSFSFGIWICTCICICYLLFVFVFANVVSDLPTSVQKYLFCICFQLGYQVTGFFSQYQY